MLWDSCAELFYICASLGVIALSFFIVAPTLLVVAPRFFVIAPNSILIEPLTQAVLIGLRGYSLQMFVAHFEYELAAGVDLVVRDVTLRDRFAVDRDGFDVDVLVALADGFDREFFAIL